MPVTHTHPPQSGTNTQGRTPPGAHATQLQTGLNKGNGLAGPRATKLPVWDGISGRSSNPLPSQPTLATPRPLVNACYYYSKCMLFAQLPLGARVPFSTPSLPSSALAVSLVHVNHHPQLTSGSRVAVGPGLKQDRTLLGRRSSSLAKAWALVSSAGDVGRPSKWIVAA